MRRMSRLVLKYKEMQKFGGVIFLLPCRVHPRAGLAYPHICNEFFNGVPDLVHARCLNAVLRDRINRHVVFLYIFEASLLSTNFVTRRADDSTEAIPAEHRRSGSRVNCFSLAKKRDTRFIGHTMRQCDGLPC